MAPTSLIASTLPLASTALADGSKSIPDASTDMTHTKTLAAITAAGIVCLAVLVGGSVAALPTMAESLPAAVTAGLVVVLVLAVVITGLTGTEHTERTPYW